MPQKRRPQNAIWGKCRICDRKITFVITVKKCVITKQIPLPQTPIRAGPQAGQATNRTCPRGRIVARRSNRQPVGATAAFTSDRRR